MHKARHVRAPVSSPQGIANREFINARGMGCKVRCTFNGDQMLRRSECGDVPSIPVILLCRDQPAEVLDTGLVREKKIAESERCCLGFGAQPGGTFMLGGQPFPGRPFALAVATAS